MHRRGGPGVLRLEAAPPPRLKPDEVLIRTAFAAVNPVDAKIRAGTFRLFRPSLPAILGRDVAGTVVEVGARAIGAIQLGDRVFGMLDYPRGTYAELAAATVRELARCPKPLPLRVAGALPVAALTAWQALFVHGQLRPGQRVLIHGGAGGLGHLAIQFAKLRGATVVTTASRRDLRWVRSLGADQAIDYARERFEDVAGNFDLVLDLLGGEVQKRSWQTLKPRGGRLVSTRSAPSASAARRHRARGILMAVAADRRQLARIADLVATGRVRVAIARVLPLRAAAKAHRRLEAGHFRGKLVLRIGGERAGPRPV